MNYNFTDRVRKVLSLAREEARKHRHAYVGTRQILMGLVREGEGVATSVMASLGATPERLDAAIREAVRPGTAATYEGDLPFTSRGKKVLEFAMAEARSLGHTHIGTEHILLGLIREERGLAAQILTTLGVTLEAARAEVAKLTGATGPVTGAGPAPSRPQSLVSSHAGAPAGTRKKQALDRFCRDLTALAREGRIDPVIGREREMRRVIQILGRRRKNNPVLIGEPGVGKTAIAEGLAGLIVQGRVPRRLASVRLLSLDIGSLIAGTKLRGEFEERLTNVMSEAVADGNVILVIDELHKIIGAGSAEGSVDAANLLKPALARGDLQVIGATTTEEYRRYLEKDGALERRFQPVRVDEPSPEEAERILLGMKVEYERHHNVQISDEVIRAAVDLSVRHIVDRKLPDKALDLIDEAASRARLTAEESDGRVAELRSELHNLRSRKLAAVREQDFAAAGELRSREEEVENRISALLQESVTHASGLRPEITIDDIADVVSLWTGVPAGRLRGTERDRLRTIDADLSARVIGQDEAVRALARVVRRRRVGFANARRPVGCFLFAGPTGVGKTELARSLAEVLFGSRDAMIRLDMSEHMERFSVSRLIGAPPGYVGYESSGMLTKAVRQRPYSVVLLDEIEKAHPDIFNLLLQIMDDGHLTDSHGRRIDFRNTVLIMTSNVGVREAKERKTTGFIRPDETARVQSDIHGAIERQFSPEFRGRLDDVIIFRSLTTEDMRSIAKLMLATLAREVRVNSGAQVEVSEAAVDWLARHGYDERYGARPLRRLIEREVEDRLSELAITGEEPGEGTVYRIDVAGDGDSLRAEEVRTIVFA